MNSASAPRIAMIHALEESVEPARTAFRQLWPEAYCFDVLDTSLAVDRAEAGRLDEAMFGRFRGLADYALSSRGRGGATAGILFTCSAFGPAIDAVKAALPIPVLRPNESAFAAALDRGSNFLLVVSFEPSRDALEAELKAMAAERRQQVTITPVVVEGALQALKAGDGQRHDALVAEAVGKHTGPDAVILGQFSLARARAEIEKRSSIPVITTPHSAVEAMRRLVSASKPLEQHPRKVSKA